MNNDVVKILLEKQQELQTGAIRKIRQIATDNIEPFSWIDEKILAALREKLTEEELIDLDRQARINLSAMKVMTNTVANYIA